MHNDSTLRLEPTAEDSTLKRVTAIRWLCGGSKSAYQVLDTSSLRIGRGFDVEVQLESVGVSRLHAELYRQGAIYALRDCGSKNGTFVNGRPIQHAGLSEGDVLRLGDMVGVVVRIHRARVDADDWVEPVPGVLFGPGLAEPLDELRQFAATELPMAVIGETGTGKDCVARTIHALSRRAGPFQAVNCAALPLALAEAELFGHRRGAFTGAEQNATGHLRAADRGTLFLDEFPELPLPIQAKLLRALQDGSIQPLGETRSVRVDVRVVVACQEPLAELVRKNRLRADLAERLNGVSLTLPSLRERRADIALLFGHFLRSYSGGRPPRVEARLLERLLLLEWRGNVRELELFTRKFAEALLEIAPRQATQHAARPRFETAPAANPSDRDGATPAYGALVEPDRNDSPRTARRKRAALVPVLGLAALRPAFAARPLREARTDSMRRATSERSSGPAVAVTGKGVPAPPATSKASPAASSPSAQPSEPVTPRSIDAAPSAAHGAGSRPSAAGAARSDHPPSVTFDPSNPYVHGSPP